MIERKPTQYVALSLPMPISTNRIWRSVVRDGKPGSIKSAEYRAWIEEAGHVLNTQGPGLVKGKYELRLTISERCRIDIDNCIKCVNDLLQKMGVVENDRLCRSLKVKFSDIPGMDVMVISMDALVGA